MKKGRMPLKNVNLSVLTFGGMMGLCFDGVKVCFIGFKGEKMAVWAIEERYGRNVRRMGDIPSVWANTPELRAVPN